jgi:nucleoside-diphosphate-sugar epimerase
MKVLVTGAQGFVGAAVRAALTAHEHTVLTLGDDVPGDLFDEPSLRSAMRDVEGVVHLAGADDPRTPLRDAERVNLIAVENVLAAARAAGVRRLVHRSHECVTRTDQHRSYTDEKLPHAPRFADPRDRDPVPRRGPRARGQRRRHRDGEPPPRGAVGRGR